MGCMFVGVLVGVKCGGLVLVFFVLLVVIGLFFMVGGCGGFGLFLILLGGFIIGFVVVVFVIGWFFVCYFGEVFLVILIIYIVIGGIGVVYFFGILWWVYMVN